jgi:phage-related holin
MLRPNPVYLHTNAIVMKDKIICMDKLQKLAFWLESVGYQILGVMFTFFAPIAGFVCAITFLVVIDVFTGVQAARHRNELISHKGWKRGVLKVAMYCGALLGGHAVWFFMLKGSPFDFNVSYGIALQILVAELLSVNENVKQVTGTGISIKWIEVLLDRFRKPKL